jgi:hypothetical protein
MRSVATTSSFTWTSSPLEPFTTAVTVTPWLSTCSRAVVAGGTVVVGTGTRPGVATRSSMRVSRGARPAMSTKSVYGMPRSGSARKAVCTSLGTSVPSSALTETPATGTGTSITSVRSLARGLNTSKGMLVLGAAPLSGSVAAQTLTLRSSHALAPPPDEKDAPAAAAAAAAVAGSSETAA